MTRQTILEDYKVSDDGIIQSLGKFEGEMLYVPYFYDAALNGFADEDEDDETIMSFTVTDEDLAMFPELEGQATVLLRESSDGFVVELY